MWKYDNRTIVHLVKYFMSDKQEEKKPEQPSSSELTKKIRSLMEQIKNQAKLQEKKEPRRRSFKIER